MASSRPYIKGWKKARLECIRLANGICAVCGKDILAAAGIPEVNHILSVLEGGELTDQSNLACVCSDCHKKHTREVIRRRTKATRGAAKHEGTFRKVKGRKVQSRPMKKVYRPVDPKNRNRAPGERGKMR